MRACISSKFLILKATSKVMTASLSPGVRTVLVTAAPDLPKGCAVIALRLPGKAVRSFWSAAAQTGALPRARHSNRSNRVRVPFTWWWQEYGTQPRE